jgi:hypothetical protein
MLRLDQGNGFAPFLRVTRGDDDAGALASQRQRILIPQAAIESRRRKSAGRNCSGYPLPPVITTVRPRCCGILAGGPGGGSRRTFGRLRSHARSDKSDKGSRRRKLQEAAPVDLPRRSGERGTRICLRISHIILQRSKHATASIGWMFAESSSFYVILALIEEIAMIKDYCS